MGSSPASQEGPASLPALVAGAGAVLLFIAAYVPWVQTFAIFTTVSVRGVETPWGRLLPLIPLVALGLLAWRWYVKRARWVHFAIMALGILTVALAVAYAVGVQRHLAQTQQSIARSGRLLPGSVRVTFDIGIYLTVAGATALVTGGILGVRQDHAS